MPVRDPLVKSWAWLMVGLMAMLMAGCAEEVGRLEMSILDKPEGGVIPTLAVLEDDEEATVFAPFGGELFTRRSNDQRWHGQPARWPVSVSASGLELFDGLAPGLSSFNFPRGQLFTAHKGMLWTVATPTFGAASRLVFSPDRGQSWHEAPLPRLLTEGGGVTTGLVGAPSEVPFSERLRLLKVANDELFLTDSQRIWRLDWGRTSSSAPMCGRRSLATGSTSVDRAGGRVYPLWFEITCPPPMLGPLRSSPFFTISSAFIDAIGTPRSGS